MSEMRLDIYVSELGQMTRSAAQKLIERIRNPEIQPEILSLPPYLVRRGSVRSR